MELEGSERMRVTMETGEIQGQEEMGAGRQETLSAPWEREGREPALLTGSHRPCNPPGLGQFSVSSVGPGTFGSHWLSMAMACSIATALPFPSPTDLLRSNQSSFSSNPVTLCKINSKHWAQVPWLGRAPPIWVWLGLPIEQIANDLPLSKAS